MAVKISWASNLLVYIHFSGVVTADELIRPNQQLVADERFDQLRGVLVNMEEVHSFDIRPVNISILATLDKGATRWNDKIRLALLGHQSSSQMVVNLYMDQMKDAKYQIQEFEKEADALDWCMGN